MNMASLLIRNGHIVDPSQHLDQVADILIEDGVIAKIAPRLSVSADRAIEALGKYVIPGLVDMHVHLRDPGQLHKEDIFTGCNSALAGGVTSLLCMPNTKPVLDNRETISYVRRTADRARAKVYICAAATKDLQGKILGDYAMYRELGVLAVSDDGKPVEDEMQMKQVMCQAKEHGLLTVSHCEDLQIVNGGIMHQGSVSKALGVKGIDRLSENNMTARELLLSEESGAPVHIAHVSTAEATDLIREAKRIGLPVTAETCPHYFAFTQDKLKNRDADYRMNPPLREQSDVSAIIEGLKDGTFDCITTDHAPHSKTEKADFFTAPNGVIGMETSLAAGYTYLVLPGHISFSQLVNLMSCRPAQLLGLHAGSLTPGYPADLVIFDDKVKWTVLPERMHSKAQNAVFKFQSLTGRVTYTFVDGELAYVQRYR